MAVFRVIKNQNYTVMCNYHLRDKNLSLKAVGLLSKMLSLSEEWNYTNRGLAAICKEGVDAIGSALRELEQNGYLVRQQLRSETGKILDTEYIIYEMPQTVSQTGSSGVIPEAPNHTETDVEPSSYGPCVTENVYPEPDTEMISDNHAAKREVRKGYISSDSSDMAVPYTENPYTADNSDRTVPYTENPYTAVSDTTKPAQLNKDILNTDISSTNPSFHPAVERLDCETAASLIRNNIEYPILAERYKKSKLDMVVDLVAELLCSPTEQVTIGREVYPYDIVKNRMLRLDSECICYAFDCLDEASANIRCIKPYLQKILFNAPVTMDSYIEAQVNSDLRNYFGGGTAR